MEFKGTKGEWINTYPIITSDEEDICEIFVHLDAYMDNSNAISEKIAEANAKLIACAPEMLEIINEIIESIKNEDIIIKDNTDNDGFEARGFYFFNKLKKLSEKATTI